MFINLILHLILVHIYLLLLQDLSKKLKIKKKAKFLCLYFVEKVYHNIYKMMQIIFLN